jgi:tetratricopeptide (TPR) repeat protein
MGYLAAVPICPGRIPSMAFLAVRFTIDMGKETDFYTATMAKVYAEQGHWDRAAEIYRHLLEQEPERNDYLAALAKIERMAKQNRNAAREQLAALFHQWFDLMLRYRNLRNLRKLKR